MYDLRKGTHVGHTVAVVIYGLGEGTSRAVDSHLLSRN